MKDKDFYRDDIYKSTPCIKCKKDCEYDFLGIPMCVACLQKE